MRKFELNAYKTIVGLTIVLAVVALSNQVIGYKVHPSSTPDFAKTTVMITRMDGKSGGTGVVLQSTGNQSLVLTNAHVCGVVKNGGVISTDTKEGLVTSYQVSEIHDLCLIKTNVNFKVTTTVADFEPDLYSQSVVSGHPKLLPTIVNTGNFSQKRVVSIMYGFRPCTEEEKNNEQLGIICAFFGGLPQVKTYQAQVVTNLIQPGSSGSAVFNSSGEISGLVFAGSGDLGYGLIVPQEYVSLFVKEEIKYLTEQKPNNEVSILEEKTKDTVKDKCRLANSSTNDMIKNMCSELVDDLIVYE